MHSHALLHQGKQDYSRCLLHREEYNPVNRKDSACGAKFIALIKAQLLWRAAFDEGGSKQATQIVTRSSSNTCQVLQNLAVGEA